MGKIIAKNLLTIIGVVLGAIGGFVYWKFVGCSTGTCPITSIWYNTTAYGAVMGGLLAGMIKSEKPKEKTKE